jgi:hypothetical protein
MGDARAGGQHITSVVEARNLTNETAIVINGHGNPNSVQLVLTERFTPVGPTAWSGLREQSFDSVECDFDGGSPC